MLISVSSKAQIVPRAEPPTACSVCTLFLAPSIKQLHYSLMFQKTWDVSECGTCSFPCPARHKLYLEQSLLLHAAYVPFFLHHPSSNFTTALCSRKLGIKTCGTCSCVGFISVILLIFIGVLVHYCLVF